MKALTVLCAAERPISNGLHSNCRNSLTITIYTRSNYLFCWKRLCLMSHILNMSVLRYCLLLFLLPKTKTLIIDMCDCLVCVENSDVNTWEMRLNGQVLYVFISAVYRKYFDTNKRLYTFSVLCYRCHKFSSSYF